MYNDIATHKVSTTLLSNSPLSIGLVFQEMFYSMPDLYLFDLPFLFHPVAFRASPPISSSHNPYGQLSIHVEEEEEAEA